MGVRAQDAGMLAAPFERPMGLDDAWEVADAWFEEVEGGPDEPHVRVARAKGRAVPCPECGARCGACDTRERAWRHLDIWQFGTHVRCAVPRADRPEHGVGTAPMPWEAGPSSHLAAPFGARVLAAAPRGAAVPGVAARVGEPDRRPWAMVRGAVAGARARADHSAAGRVGTGEAGRAGGHACVSAMPGLDGGRVAAVTGGGDRGAVGRPCGRLDARGGDRAAVGEVTRDVSGALASGVASGMPQAVQAAGRFHVTRPFPKATDKVRRAGRGESAEKAEAPGRTKYAWLRREESPTDWQRAKREGLDRGGRASGPRAPAR